MDVNYSIRFAVSGPLDLSAGINASVLPLLHQAVGAVAAQTEADWKTAVYKAPGVWSGEKDAYADSITWQMTGDFSAVVSTDYAKASEIETGRPARDLKKMLDTSQKVRRTLDGRRFLVIPMRHNTPGNTALGPAMPQGVYGLAQAMAPSSVVKTGRRASGEVTHLSPKTGMHAAGQQTPYLSNTKTQKAMMVARRTYAWGDRIGAAALREMGASKAEVKRYQGMVKMQTSTPGGSTSSSYLTFRIMGEWQTGKWIVPAKPGLFIAKGVADAMQPKAEAAFKAAVTKTVTG